MKYLLDTNIVSYWMRGDETLIRRLAEMSPADLAMAAVTFAEISYGIEKSPHKKAERRLKLTRIADQLSLVSFDRNAAIHYAVIRADLEKRGVPISERDLQIASIASSRRLCLVTHNGGEFSRIPKLVFEDWFVG